MSAFGPFYDIKNPNNFETTRKLFQSTKFDVLMNLYGSPVAFLFTQISWISCSLSAAHQALVEAFHNLSIIAIIKTSTQYL